jgi:hypothetical protein
MEYCFKQSDWQIRAGLSDTSLREDRFRECQFGPRAPAKLQSLANEVAILGRIKDANISLFFIEFKEL